MIIEVLISWWCVVGAGDALEDVECGEDGCQTEGLENQACLPIPVAVNDTDFGGQRCLMFVRSQDVTNRDCKVGGFYTCTLNLYKPIKMMLVVYTWILPDLNFHFVRVMCHALRTLIS